MSRDLSARPTKGPPLETKAGVTGEVEERHVVSKVWWLLNKRALGRKRKCRGDLLNTHHPISHHVSPGLKMNGVPMSRGP